jgi:hypothetical protein
VVAHFSCFPFEATIIAPRERERPVPVAELLVQLDDGVLLLLGEVAALDVRAQVVDPPEAAALAAAQQARLLGEGAPVAVAEALDVGDEDPVLLGRPRALVQTHLLAARSPPHCFFSLLWGKKGAHLLRCPSRAAGQGVESRGGIYPWTRVPFQKRAAPRSFAEKSKGDYFIVRE